MKYYTYILKSLINNDIYVGSTANLKMRIQLHNIGKVRSTKAYRPWQLLEYHEYPTRSEAVLAERFFKNHQQKEMLKNKHK